MATGLQCQLGKFTMKAVGHTKADRIRVATCQQRGCVGIPIFHAELFGRLAGGVRIDIANAYNPHAGQGIVIGDMPVARDLSGPYNGHCKLFHGRLLFQSRSSGFM